MKIKNRPAVKMPQGFSLIELMIAIPISLLVLLAVLKIFTGTMQGVNLQNGFSQVQENGRMAIEMISRDIRGADYWGCANNSANINNILSDPDAVDLNLISNGGIGGENNVSASTVIGGKNVIADTDTLTLRGAHSYSDALIATAMTAANSTLIKLTTVSNIATDNIILLSDCESGDIFTNIATDSNNKTISYTGTLSKAYAVGAQILSPSSMTYFIAQSGSADGVNSLYRSVNGTASELVRGINDLQIAYGVDSNASGSVDTYYVAGDSGLVMGDVVVIRVELVSESSGSGSALKRTFTVTTAIRNRTI